MSSKRLCIAPVHYNNTRDLDVHIRCRSKLPLALLQHVAKKQRTFLTVLWVPLRHYLEHHQCALVTYYQTILRWKWHKKLDTCSIEMKHESRVPALASVLFQCCTYPASRKMQDCHRNYKIAFHRTFTGAFQSSYKQNLVASWFSADKQISCTAQLKVFRRCPQSMPFDNASSTNWCSGEYWRLRKMFEVVSPDITTWVLSFAGTK